MLDRDVDRWIPYNEQYYWEMSHAVYSQDLNQFENLLDKYQIGWVLLDLNVIEPGTREKTLFLYELQQLFRKSSKVKLTQRFGDVLVYEVQPQKQYQHFIFSPASAEVANTNAIKDHLDLLYQKQRNYISSTNRQPYYPFHALVNRQNVQIDFIPGSGYRLTNFSVPSTSRQLEIPSPQNFRYIPIDVLAKRTASNQTLLSLRMILPTIYANNQLIWQPQPTLDYIVDSSSDFILSINESDVFDVSNLSDNDNFTLIGESRLSLLKDNQMIARNEKQTNLLDITITHGEIINTLQLVSDQVNLPSNVSSIQVRLSPHAGYLQKTFDFDLLDITHDTAFNTIPKSCTTTALAADSSYDKDLVRDLTGNYLQYSAHNTSSCDAFGFWELNHDVAYLLDINYRNLGGLGLYVCLANYYSDRCDLRFRLDNNGDWQHTVLVQPPMNNRNRGYGVSVDTISIGEPSINQLRSVSMQSFPYEWIKQIKLIAQESTPPTVTKPLIIQQVNHPNPAVYHVTMEPIDSDGLLVLNQSYEPNWIGISYHKNGALTLQLLPHHQANNWANAWIIPAETERILIFFLPQLLQTVGFILLIGWLLYLIKKHTVDTAKER